MAAPSGLGVKTHLAEKYSHPTGDIHDVLRNYYPSLKSGLTPVTPGPHANQQEESKHGLLESYQILRLKGFTAREYADLDSLAASVDLSDNDSLLEFLDSSPIHPFYSKRNWRVPMTANLARYPLGDGNEYWEADNPRVWNAMLPALKIASLAISKATTFPWIDALFEGHLETVPASQVPTGFQRRGSYTKFGTQSSNVMRIFQDVNKRWKAFSTARNLKSFQMHGIRSDAFTGMPLASGAVGHTTKKVGDHTRISFAFEAFEPLLDQNLSSAERMVQTVCLASLILHESAHAMGIFLRDEKIKGYPRLVEPYFVDEPLSELGYSFERGVFGDRLEEITGTADGIPAVPAGAVYRENWPNISFSNYVPQNPVLLSSGLPPNWSTIQRFPIPVRYFVGLHSRSFWKGHFIKYGPRSIHLEPRTLGIELGPIVWDSKKSVPWSFKEHSDPTRFIYPTGPEQIFPEAIDISMPATDVMAAKLVVESKRRALEITAATKKFDPAKNYDDLEDMSKYAVEEHLLTRPVLDYPPRTPLPDPERADPDVKPFPRFNEIVDHLERNRTALALDTMHFPLPEHVVRMYILKHGGIALTAGEWRRFLKRANTLDEYFAYSELGYGTVARIDEGWALALRPQDTPPLPIPTIPSDVLMDTFHLCIRPSVRGESFDFDKARMLVECNLRLKSQYKKRLRILPNGFEQPLFDSLLHHSPMFLNAPRDIARAEDRDNFAPGWLKNEMEIAQEEYDDEL